jgi:hypothetical protein
MLKRINLSRFLDKVGISLRAEETTSEAIPASPTVMTWEDVVENWDWEEEEYALSAPAYLPRSSRESKGIIADYFWKRGLPAGIGFALVFLIYAVVFLTFTLVIIPSFLPTGVLESQPRIEAEGAKAKESYVWFDIQTARPTVNMPMEYEIVEALAAGQPEPSRVSSFGHSEEQIVDLRSQVFQVGGEYEPGSGENREVFGGTEQELGTLRIPNQKVRGYEQSEGGLGTRFGDEEGGGWGSLSKEGWEAEGSNPSKQTSIAGAVPGEGEGVFGILTKPKTGPSAGGLSDTGGVSDTPSSGLRLITTSDLPPEMLRRLHRVLREIGNLIAPEMPGQGERLAQSIYFRGESITFTFEGNTYRLQFVKEKLRTWESDFCNLYARDFPYSGAKKGEILEEMVDTLYQAIKTTPVLIR